MAINLYRTGQNFLQLLKRIKRNFSTLHEEHMVKQSYVCHGSVRKKNARIHTRREGASFVDLRELVKKDGFT